MSFNIKQLNVWLKDSSKWLNIKAALVFAGLGVFILIVFIILLIFQGHLNFNGLDLGKASNTGEFIGGIVGTFFTIATTILVYLTYQTQKEELKAAREDASASSQALKLQARTTQLQQFENTFFNLLSNHQAVLKSIEESWYRYEGEGNDNIKRVAGKELIDTIVIFIKKIITKPGIPLHEYNSTVLSTVYRVPYEKTTLRSIFSDFKLKSCSEKETYVTSYLSEYGNVEDLPSLYHKIFDLNRSSLGHYFRNLFHFIKFVDEYKGFDSLYSEKEIEDFKYKYIRLVRAQLSNNELILLALNSITDFGKAFIPLIEKYNLLKNTNIIYELGEMENLIEKYPHFKNFNSETV